MTKSYARYTFSGVADISRIRDGEIIGQQLDCQKVPFAYLFTSEGICSDGVISKDQALMMCREMLKAEMINADEAARIDEQIHACLGLPETICEFRMDEQEDGEIVGRIRTFKNIVIVRSKQYALWHLDKVERAGSVHPQTKKVMCEQVRESNLPKSCAAVKQDDVVELLDANGDRFGAPICSIEQGMMTVLRLRRSKQITDDEYNTLKAEMVKVCRAKGMMSFTSQMHFGVEAGSPYALVVSSEPTGVGESLYSKVTAHKHVEKYVKDGYIAPQRESVLHEQIDQSDLPHSTARLFHCDEGHWHMIDEFNNHLSIELYSKRQALDQLNEATRNGKFYMLSFKRVERQIRDSDMPDTHESDNDYLHKHGKDCGLFNDLVN